MREWAFFRLCAGRLLRIGGFLCLVSYVIVIAGFLVVLGPASRDSEGLVQSRERSLPEPCNSTTATDSIARCRVTRDKGERKRMLDVVHSYSLSFRVFRSDLLSKADCATPFAGDEHSWKLKGLTSVLARTLSSFAWDCLAHTVSTST